MSWFRKLWAEFVVTIFMMVGISPPEWARRESASKTNEQEKTDK